MAWKASPLHTKACHIPLPRQAGSSVGPAVNGNAFSPVEGTASTGHRLIGREPVAVAVHSCGDFRLKGVTEVVGVAQVLPLALQGRLQLFQPATSLKVRWWPCLLSHMADCWGCFCFCCC